jgi:thiamine biosynthesis protein ThiS
MSVNLTVNGKALEIEGPIPLVEFLKSSGVNIQFIAVAYNGDVLEREQFANVMLTEGDDLELVRPVGGG